MKKLMLAVIAIPLAVACNQNLKEENARLKTENEELSMDNAAKDSILDNFVTSMTAIQENLATIREKEESIESARQQGFENTPDQREQVLKDVEAINELLAENKQTIGDLNDKISRYSYEVGKFKKMVANLNTQIEEKDQQVIVLKENLAAANFEMSRLNARLDTISSQNKEQRDLIKSQTEELNTAYYAVGNYKTLQDNEVLTKKGGVIGIGSTKTFASDFNKDYFTRIDITKTTSIPLNIDDKAKLVSEHPSDSYSWVKDGEKITALEISNPQRFWKSSKYLVVLVD